MGDERFDIDVGYRDPDDLPRDDFPEDKPSPAEYEDDLLERVTEAIAAVMPAFPNPPKRCKVCNGTGTSCLTVIRVPMPTYLVP